jgi:hypothetical protein
LVGWSVVRDRPVEPVELLGSARMSISAIVVVFGIAAAVRFSRR